MAKSKKPAAREEEEEVKVDVKIKARLHPTEGPGRKLDAAGNIVLAEDIPFSKLSRFIYTLEDRLNSEPCNYENKENIEPEDELKPAVAPASPPNNNMLKKPALWLSTWINEEAARFVTAWIVSEADKKHPNPLPCPHDFESAVYVHHAAKVFNIVREVRGELVRGNLLWYMRELPLTCSEFAMCVEQVPWDLGLVRLAKQSVIAAGKGKVPEFDKILEYCVKNSLMASMFDLGLKEMKRCNSQRNGDAGEKRVVTI